MTNGKFKLTLSFITPEDTFLEHESRWDSSEDAIEEANEIAFKFVGYPLEDWGSKPLDFGNGNCMFLFYPNEEDKTSRYRLMITEIL